MPKTYTESRFHLLPSSPTAEPPRKRITVVAAAGNSIMQRGIASLLETEDDIELVAQPTNGSDALKAITAYQPDIAVLNLKLSGKDSIELVETLQRSALKTRPVILATRITEQEFLRIIRLGVRGVMLKEMPAFLLARCIRTVHGGGEFIEKEAFLKAFAKLLQDSHSANRIGAVLTERELDVVKLVMGGLRNKQIARKLSISEGTVKVHLHSSYEKLGVHGRMGLLPHAQKEGLI